MTTTPWVRYGPWTKWKPEKVGDTLEGVYLGMRQIAAKSGAAFYSVGVHTANGDRRYASFLCVVDLVRNAKLEAGARVVFTYVGQRTTRRGYTLHEFEMVCQQPQPEKT